MSRFNGAAPEMKSRMRPPNTSRTLLNTRRSNSGDWVSETWRQTADRVETLAAGLLALDIEPEQRVGIASSTRYEWILADLAIMCAGAATTTVYPNTNAGGTAYILADSECRVVFAEALST